MIKYQCGGREEGSHVVASLQIQSQTEGCRQHLAREGQKCKGCVGSRGPKSEAPARHCPWSLF